MTKRSVFLMPLFVMVLANLSASAQIGITTVPLKAEKPGDIFDSTKNFLGDENIQSYQHQTLYVLPSTINKYGEKKTFRTIAYASDSNAYELCFCKEHYNINYEQVAGKYFVVDTVMFCYKYYSNGYKKSEPECIFILSEKDNVSNKCCFIYHEKFERYFPFIVVSHFNYLKTSFTGKEYVISDSFINDVDIKTGEKIEIKDASKMVWKATDITIVESVLSEPPLAIVLESGDMTTYIEYFWFYQKIAGQEKTYQVLYEKSEWTKLVTKYGLQNMQSALKREPRVGMPEKLLLLSSGEPQRVTKKSNGDKTFYYGGETIEIRGGKVISWKKTK